MISQLYLRPRWVLYVGRSFDSQEHTHHAVQLSIGLDGPLRLNTGGGQQTELPAATINSETPHSLKVEGRWVASLYLEPESEDYDRLVNYYPGEQSSGFKVLRVADELKEKFLELLEKDVNPVLAEQLVQKLIEPAAIGAGQSLDPRIIRVLKHLEQCRGSNVPLNQLAKHVNLSPDRLTHVFRQQVGTPIRRFILWQKLRLAAEAACQGKSLIDAAQEGGFTDSAHLTHSFQKLFGINPSFLFSRDNQLSVHVG